MIIIVLSTCPNKIRGDLTRWMFEISTNVFVGRLSVRVRDMLWDRIISEIGDGKAVMVFGCDNEQRFDFRVCNSDFVPQDFDGLRIMGKPS